MYKIVIFGLLILLFDIPWLYYYMAGTYKSLFDKLGLELNMNIVGAVIAYSIMIISFPYLIEDKDKTKMLQRAAMLGFCIYGTYAFTLHAILPEYDIKLALTEVVWGTLLYTSTTKLVQYLY